MYNSRPSSSHSNRTRSIDGVRPAFISAIAVALPVAACEIDLSDRPLSRAASTTTCRYGSIAMLSIDSTAYGVARIWTSAEITLRSKKIHKRS